jgi:hypothetical protein
MSQTYTYSISGDTANGSVTPSILELQINGAGITSGTLEQISTTGDNLDIQFDQALSAPDKTTLDGVVAAHAGVTLNDTTQQVTSEGISQTTATTFQSKVGGTAQPLSAGTYLLSWYCELRVLSGGLGDHAEAQIDFNGTSVGSGNVSGTEWHPASGSGALTFADGDTPTFDIDFRVNGAGGDTAGIRRARLYLVPVNE